VHHKGIVPFLLFMLFICTPISYAQEQHVVEIGPGQSGDAYFEINLTGHVYVYLVGEPGGEACADFWWIKWPLGTTETLGRFCNEAKFEIPGWTSFAFSTKLRVGGTKNRVKVAVRENSEVAYKHTITF